MNNFPAMTEAQRQELIQACRDILRYADDYSQVEVRMARVALAALTAETVAWVVMAPHGDYIERNPEVVAHFEGAGLAKCKPLFTAPPAPVLCSPAYHDEAKRLAELHGMSFVVFRHGEAPVVADPTRVIIGFTDKGLGHDTTGDQQ